MRALTDSDKILILLVLFTATRPTLCLEEYKHEAHGIMKRMADGGEGFEGHDVARVHLVGGQRQRRDGRAIKLSLASGSKVKMALEPSKMTNPDTVVSYLTARGRVKANRVRETDCYFHGKVHDSSGQGWAAISHCDGLFGFASSPDFEYFLHPVDRGAGRHARDVSPDYDVHVMWRRSQASRKRDATWTDFPEDNDDVMEPPDDKSPRDVGSEKERDSEAPSKDEQVRDTPVEKEEEVLDSLDDESLRDAPGERNDVLPFPDERLARDLQSRQIYKHNATGIVIETAIFSDAHYWQLLQQTYPGREDDFLLTRLAATQALFSNRKRLGYDIQIKVKLLEYWTTDPVGYTFGQKLSKNLKSFCDYARDKYNYDLHVINTGISDNGNGNVGLAYGRGMCTRAKCFACLSLKINSFVAYAHEIGHSMGMSHLTSDQCPQNLKYSGGFMGGGLPYNFSPCMKYQLANFLNKSKSDCLFEETGHTKTPMEFNHLPNVFPGQFRSPDGLCHILAGPAYKYVPFGKTLGKPVCKWMICLDEDKASLEFGRARRFVAPNGFPCEEESFCISHECQHWNQTAMLLEIKNLREMRKIPSWSDWSSEFSECSRSCGTGVRTRRRECQIVGFNLATYCPGMSMIPELCNVEPCPGDPTEASALRQVRGDEVCARFLRNKVRLNLKEAKGYRATSSGDVRTGDAGAIIRTAHSLSCMLKCDRDPIDAEGDLDAFMPDGTPCFDTERSKKDLIRFNVQLRCVEGFCLEFTDCPKASQTKDKCGVCGGDGKSC